MKKEIADAWVKELRSGNYKQATGVLKSCGDGFCCLGVLSDMYVKTFPEIATWDDGDFTILGTDQYENLNLPEAVMKWSGVRNYAGRVGNLIDDEGYEVILANLNDDGSTFDEIADVIEEHWEKL